MAPLFCILVMGADNFASKRGHIPTKRGYAPFCTPKKIVIKKGACRVLRLLSSTNASLQNIRTRISFVGAFFASSFFALRRYCEKTVAINKIIK